jgi:hypothetical protein
MTSIRSAIHNASIPDFSLTAGGLFYQLLRRLHLVDESQMQLKPIVMVIVPVLAWLPLLVLSGLEGRLAGNVAVPFLQDQEAHIRLLVALPLLLAAEIATSHRMRPLLRMFHRRNLISEGERPRLDAIAASMFRLRDSVLPEIAVIAFVYGVGITVVWRQLVALQTATWYATESGGVSSLTIAGLWYGYVSLPIFQFLLCRWYLRLIIWARFLWQVSGIRLNLQPTHPDRVGGLSFISAAMSGLVVLAVALGTLLAAYVSTRVFQMAASLYDFKTEAALMVVFVLCIVIGPLLVFSPQLRTTRRAGLAQYGTLATGYVEAFGDKWLRGSRPADEELLGSADIQSLADLGNSYGFVQAMRTVLFSKEDVIRFAVATLVPVAPLALAVLPLDELVNKLIGILF